MPTLEAIERRAKVRYDFAKGVAGLVTLALVLGLLAFSIVQTQRLNDLVRDAAIRAEQGRQLSEQNQRVLKDIEDIFISLEAGQKEARGRLSFALQELDRRLDVSDQKTVDAINRLIREFNRTHPDNPIQEVRNRDDTRPRTAPPSPRPSASPSPSPSPSCKVHHPLTGECVVK